MKKRFIPLIILLFFNLPLCAQAETDTTPTPATSPTPPPLQVQGPQNVAKLTFQTMEDGRLLVSATDADENPIRGLTPENFSIHQGPKTAKVLTVEPLATSKEVGLNIVMVVDNSKSMKFREAVGPLSDALKAFYSTLRPIDTVSAIVFDDQNTTTVDGRALHARGIQTKDSDQLRAFLRHGLNEGLTEGTYLFDAIRLGLDMAGRMPAKDNKFLVIFSDGEDINSDITAKEVENLAGTISNLAVYAVDYMPGPDMDPFLSQLSSQHHGRSWKAASAAQLLPVFQAFSSILLHRYLISYRFLEPPKGTVAFEAQKLTIEEVTTIDSSPLLNQIYFETGQSELTNRYVLFANAEEAKNFNEKNLTGALDKYRHVLNIIGLRLQNNHEANLRIVGCNSNVGKEKGRTDLSRGRAEAVRAYLRYVWGIAPERMLVEPRNLPEAASTNRIPEGQAENQRVELYSDYPDILDTVDSAYVQKVSDLNQLRIAPHIESEVGLADWQVDLFCGMKENHPFHSFKGHGAPPAEWTLPLDAVLIEELSNCGSLQMKLQASDTEGNSLSSAEPILLPIHYIRRTEQSTQIQGYKVVEQYALILFDYDSAAIKGRNQAIVERIIKRMHQVPDAKVTIVGHTDTIGKEAYNLALSDRRAQAVKQTILAVAADMAQRLEVKGVGPNAPLYDNDRPEGRALNRTVTITLEYKQK
ncbi:MAG: OmpA family protein [Desulfobacteraceae bacterium]|nr:OmpA family protein [Desulfobacteraceae bacterium]